MATETSALTFISIPGLAYTTNLGFLQIAVGYLIGRIVVAYTLLPLYVQNMLIPSVVARPLQGEPPTIDLVMGYNKSNTSPLLKQFVSRADELVAGVKRQSSLKYVQAR